MHGNIQKKHIFNGDHQKPLKETLQIVFELSGANICFHFLLCVR